MEKKREFRTFIDMEEEAPVTEPIPEPSSAHACVNYEKDEEVPEPIPEPLPEPTAKVVSRPNKPNFIGRKW